MSEKLCTLRTKGGGGGKQTETVLWTNSSPTSNFADQNVTLSDSMSNYDYLKFTYKKATNNAASTSAVFSVSDVKNFADESLYGQIGGESATDWYMSRMIWYVSDTSVKISTAWGLNRANSANNAYIIPLSIIGIKNMVERTNVTGIVKDFDNQLARLTATNQSYTATEDCVMTAYIAKTASNQTVGVKVNGTTNQDVLVFCGQSSPVNTELFVGTYSSNGSPYGIYLPKGTTAYTYGTGTFDVRFYKIKQT